MKTKEEYVASLRRLKPGVYMLGERVTNVVDRPIIRPSADAMAATYELAYGDVMTATSHLTGNLRIPGSWKVKPLMLAISTLIVRVTLARPEWVMS